MRPLALGMLALMLSACSDDTDKTKQDGGLTTDLNLTDSTSLPDSGPASCGEGVYPCGPYGTKTNDVAGNLEFLGYADEGEQCDKHQDKVMDLSKQRRVSFKDFFLGDPAKSCKRKLLWVIVSAGWCGPCQKEVKDAQEQYAAGQVDPRLALLNVVFETDDPGTPITKEFTEAWIKTFKITFPVAMDPTFKMGAYFIKSATPFNMLVDLSNMKIYYQQTGGDASTIGPQIQNFLKGL